MAAPDKPEKAKAGECVKVVIRCRPMNSQEKIDNRECIVSLDTKSGVARVRRPGTKDEKDFTFDSVYDENTVQANFYDQTGYPVVESVLDGYNGTIFAYGQTGTGKTHTMVGPPNDEELAGVIPRTFAHIFRSINVNGGKKFLVRASYLEIYNEEIRDLLSKTPKQKLELKDHPDGGVFVKDLSNLIVKGVDDLNSVMEVGQKNRSVASTLMNNESSRSHSIFTITVEQAEAGEDGEDHIRVGKMNMVDLAGSERQSKTGASGDTLKEATKINMSLSALGNVISALVDSKTSFIPYRDSKLTRLLQDSLGGNTKTVMCACIGPVDYNYDESISTLRYAYRAKSIKNKPKINEDPKDAMIREFQDEIARLKVKLLESRSKPTAEQQEAIVRVKREKKEAAYQAQEVVVETEVVEVEKVVDKEVIVEKVVQCGITDEDVQRVQANLEQERAVVEAQYLEEQRYIEAQTNMAEEEKQKLLEDLQMRKQQREDESQANDRMMQQLKAMEDKMLVGSQVMEKAMEQEQDLRRAEIEVEERKREEHRMKEELDQQVEEKMNLEDKYTSTEEQVSKMTAKLEKLWNRHKQTQQEIQDLQAEFQNEREDMLETIRDLRKEVKLVCLTIDSFCPMEQYQQIVERAHYDDSTDEWVISNIDLAGNRVRPARKRILDNSSGDSPRALLRGPDRGDDQTNELGLMNERPNVFFAYTEDGGATRAEARPAPQPKQQKGQRLKSAGRRGAAERPNTANRKGRAVKTGGPGGSPGTGMNNFLHSPEEDDGGGPAPYPKARGLVKNA